MTATVTELHPSFGGVLPRGQINAVQLADRSGAAYRQVDYWTRAGYLHSLGPPTPGSGHQRAYLEAEIPMARLMRDLVDAGLTVPAAHDHARVLLEHGHTVIAGMTLHLPQDL